MNRTDAKSIGSILCTIAAPAVMIVSVVAGWALLVLACVLLWRAWQEIYPRQAND